eukprot:2079021-Pleurochrysis_carterae.AAC.4
MCKWKLHSSCAHKAAYTYICMVCESNSTRKPVDTNRSSKPSTGIPQVLEREQVDVLYIHPITVGKRTHSPMHIVRVRCMRVRCVRTACGAHTCACVCMRLHLVRASLRVRGVHARACVRPRSQVCARTACAPVRRCAACAREHMLLACV